MSASRRVASRRRGVTLVSAAYFAIALGAPGLWRELAYEGVAPNTVTFTETGLRIDVQGSASPLILALERPVAVSSIEVAGRLTGGPLKLGGRRQGAPGADDFALRVGFVVPGERRLNFVERQFAPSWVLELSDLAPEGLGLGHVHFLNAVQDGELLGLTRVHPASDLISEEFAWRLGGEGPFALEHSFAVPLMTQAIWIAADGDDTGSRFVIEIDRLVIGAE